MKYLLLIISMLWALVSLAQSVDSLEVSSPNGQLKMRFSIQSDGSEDSCLFYSLGYKSQPVVLPSRLGLKSIPHSFRDIDWHKQLRVVKTEKRSQNTSWQPVYGERSVYPDHFNELIITLQHTNPQKKASMQLVARAYNEGVAFRYYFPESTSTQILEFGEELTQFRLPAGTQAWHTHRAQEVYHKVPLKDWEKDAELPLTLDLPNGIYASIAQAEQVNYPRIRLKTMEQEGTLATRLFGETVETSPYGSSWRVVLVAEKPGQLLENNYILLNLNPPSQLKNTDWIKPGTVMREVTLSTSGARKLVDFAVEQQIDYIHFDAGWYGPEQEVASDATTVTLDPARNPNNNLDLPEAIRYAKSKGKKVLLYVNHRALESQLDTLLPLFQSWGVDGIKFGFVHTGSHRWTTWLHDAVKKAAKYNMVVNIHDEYRPTGFSRTYPNLLTQEGILGNEGFPGATHNTILPFTRFIAGAADYTPCFNIEAIRPGKNNTTKAHQLALPVIYYSPLQVLYWYGKPEHFPDRDEIAFWKGIPTVWENSRVLAGTPGEFVTIARQKDKTWYIGTITNEQPRSMEVNLNFLESDKTYTATIYEDDGKGGISRKVQRVTSSTTLKAALHASGGQAILIKE